jgi:hypothetical protein
MRNEKEGGLNLLVSCQNHALVVLFLNVNPTLVTRVIIDSQQMIKLSISYTTLSQVSQNLKMSGNNNGVEK